MEGLCLVNGSVGGHDLSRGQWCSRAVMLCELNAADGSHVVTDCGVEQRSNGQVVEVDESNGRLKAFAKRWVVIQRPAGWMM